MKKLTLEQARKEGSKFYWTGNTCKYGHVDFRYTGSKLCVQCSKNHQKKCRENLTEEQKEKIRERDRVRSKTENPRRKEYQKKWREENKEYIKEYKKQWAKENKESNLNRIRKWQKNNPEKHRSYCRKWEQENKHKVREKCRRRQVAKKQGSLDDRFKKEIQEIYRKCPKGYHVDHIIPINGDNVSGLHVPWNLQYLTPEENCKKGNKHDDS